MSLCVLVPTLPVAPRRARPPCFPSLCLASLFFLSLSPFLAWISPANVLPHRLRRTRNRTRARKAPSGVFVMPIVFSFSFWCIPLQHPPSSLCVSFFDFVVFLFFSACIVSVLVFACLSVYVHIRMCVRGSVCLFVYLPLPLGTLLPLMCWLCSASLSVCMSLALLSCYFSSPLSCLSTFMFLGVFFLYFARSRPPPRALPLLV